MTFTDSPSRFLEPAQGAAKKAQAVQTKECNSK